MVHDEIRIIDLDSVSSFSELRKIMGELACQGKVLGLSFRSNDTIYHLTGFADCPTSSTIGCYFRKNQLVVTNDSLIIESGENKKPIEYLKTELNEIMSKEYAFQYGENKLKPALIRFYVEDKYPISTTKRVLKEIFKQFEHINSKNSPDFFKYNILFEENDYTKRIKVQLLSPPKPDELDN